MKRTPANDTHCRQSYRTEQFVEYFYTFGIDSNTAFSEYINFAKPFEENDRIKPKLINQFPLYPKPNSYIEPSVLMKHCFPNGFIPIETVLCPKEEVFHFSLDNLLQHDEYPKLYFTVLIFYEALTKYKQMKKDYESTVDKEEKEDSKDNSFTNNQKIRRNSFDFELRKKTKLEPVPLRFLKKGRSYSFDCSIKIERNANIVNMFFPKAICLSSLVPFPNQQGNILTEIYQYVKLNRINEPLEKIIDYLTMELPMPTRGINKICYNLLDKKIEISQQPLNKLPYSTYNMSLIFKFTITEIIEIYRNILLEIPILIFDTKKEELTNIIESFISFLYPFNYQYPYVSILPEINYGLIEMKKCFVFGINKKYTDNFFTENNLNIVNKSIVIVDLNKGKKGSKIKTYYCYDKELPMIGIHELGEPKNDPTIYAFPAVVQLPNRYKGKLYDRLNDKYKILHKEKKAFEYNEEVNEYLANVFFYFIVSILNDYLRYTYNDSESIKTICEMLQSNTKPSIYKIFKVNEFLLSTKENVFYKNFFETKLFYAFISKRYLHNETEERLKILFFDESIGKKKNKRVKIFAKDIPTPFLDDKCFLFDDKGMSYGSKNKGFSKNEISFIVNKSTNPILNYQHITENKSKIKYYLFPKLFTDDYLYPKSRPAASKQVLVQQFWKNKDRILNDNSYFEIYKGALVEQAQVSISKLLFKNEMENYLYLLWLRLFCITFYYCEENEKNFRFYEMLANLKKITFLDSSTLSLLFLAISQYGNEFMAIKLYETIEDKGFIPYYSEYAYLCNKLSSEVVYKSFMKKFSILSSKMSVVYFKEREDEYKMYEPTQENLDALKKRTFGCEADNNEEDDEEIKFDSDVKCPLCEKSSELPLFTISFDNMNKENEMGKCQYCHKPIAPTIKVRLGENEELESFKLSSPYHLYQMMNDVIKQYQTKLDFDAFRKEYNDLFWNCIWYFFLKGLSYDILLKYKDDSIGIKRTESTPNPEYCDDLIVDKNVVNISYLSTCSEETE